MNYIAYRFVVNPPQPGSEILMAVIADLGFESFDHNDEGFDAYIPEDLAKDLNLAELIFNDFTYVYSTEKIEQVNWNAEWEKNFEPVVINDLLGIRAPFHEKNNSVKYEIVIMPKMSFGTGHHQTTRLACEQMSRIDFKDKRVLDMGTGTGILAIFAKQLGATDILGIDVDEWSVENALENCASNGATNIKIKRGDVESLLPEQPFDVILANINKNILKKQLPVYAQKIKAGGTLLLSGFFTTDVDELKQLGENLGFNFISIAHENEWAVLVLQKH